MTSSTLLIAAIVAALLTIGESAKAKAPKDCKVGDQWTEKFIRFECYAGAGKGAKGAHGAIGCVPANTADGKVIKPGATHNEQHFTYSCAKSGTTILYQIINCRDSRGKAVAFGTTTTMADGAVWKCEKGEKDVVNFKMEKEGGCVYNKTTVLKVGQKWMQSKEFKAKVGKSNTVIGNGTMMRCKSNGKGGFLAEAYGCVTTTGKVLSDGGLIKVDSVFVQCKISEKGEATMNLVNEKVAGCLLNGKTAVKHGDNYTTPDGVDVYACKYTVIKKIGCMINKKFYGPGLRNVGGKKPHYYHCLDKDPGLFDFGELTGCAMSKKEIKPFDAKWLNGTEFHRCWYDINKAKKKITAVISFYGCDFYGKAIGKNKIAKHEKELKKCAKVGKVYKMRELTKEELADYNKPKPKKPKHEREMESFSEDGSAGAGGMMNRQPAQPAQPSKDKSKKKPIVSPVASLPAKPDAKVEAKPKARPDAKPDSKPDPNYKCEMMCTGRSCANIDECAAGTHTCHSRAACTDKDPRTDNGVKFECKCKKGWTKDPAAGTMCHPCVEGE